MPKGLQGFQKGNKLWENFNSVKNRFKAGHSINLGRKRPDMVGNQFRCDISPWNKGLKGKQSWMNISGLQSNYWLNKKRPMLSKNMRGKKHWNWKGGITPERTKIYFSKEYTGWVKRVYKKDNYTCKKCGDNSGNNLIPHHIESFADYPKLRFDVNNGITLCKNCHTYFHSKYGTHHNTKQQLEEFLNEKQEAIITSRGRQVVATSGNSKIWRVV